MTNRKTIKGKFKPRNPQKYQGDASNIVYRSGWERRCMVYFDENTNVLQWQSEEVVIPYTSPLDNRTHRYFPDFVIIVKQSDGSTKTVMIEVKPLAQTKPPRTANKQSKKFLSEVATWGVNEAKWSAAKIFCNHAGWEFKLVTERELGIK